jgi:TolB-like protein/Flp pilus assembly protein TadD
MVLPRFLTELKRRKVYRVALVYSGVGWVLLEAADVVLPRLGLPDWTVNVVLAVVLLGFPLALVFAWIFDFSPQGIVRSQPISPEAHHRFSFISIAEFLLICVLVVTVGYLYVDRLSLQQRLAEPETAVQEEPEVTNPEQYRAVAVLPFADMSEAGDQAWFAEGVAEELLHALAGVEELQVMARTSSFAFKNTDKTIAEIADILGVQAVLEGSVRRSGDRVRVTAQLVDASSGYHIWSGSYERQLSDIFQLQDELARGIVQTLRLELGVDRTEPLIAEQTTRPEAYDAFIRGRAIFDIASPQDLNQSIRFFEVAVKEDHNYAKAWGYLALARSYRVLWQSVNDVSAPTTTAYEQAPALDPNQSEALTAKALMIQLLHRDWETAGILYQRALAAREDSYGAMLAYSVFYLANIDEIPRAIRLLSEAERGDPLQAGYKSNIAMLHIWGGDPQTAVNKAQEALDLNPRHLFALMALIEAYTAKGEYPAALSLARSLPESLQQEPRIRGRVGWVYALQGDKDKAREIYQDIRNTTPSHYAIMAAAVLASSLGEVEEAIDILEHEVENHSWNQVFIRLYFRKSKPVGEHPRYLALLERVGLDDKSVAELKDKLSFD